MLAHAHEIEQTLAAVRQAKGNAGRPKGPYDRRIEIGGMIEVPAAALSLKYFINKLDFLSIGTNDLISTRSRSIATDDTVAHLYDPLHPAVLQLIAQTSALRSAPRPRWRCAGKWRETRHDASSARLRTAGVSMHPAQLLAIKQQVLRTRVREVEKPAAAFYRALDPGRARVLSPSSTPESRPPRLETDAARSPLSSSRTTRRSSAAGSRSDYFDLFIWQDSGGAFVNSSCATTSS